MQSSIGHARQTVELECDVLFILEEYGARGDEGVNTLTESERAGSWAWWKELERAKKTASRIDVCSITRTAMSAATDSPKKSKSKPSKEKKSQGKSQNERLKIVVRRLPPNLPEDIFWQSVSEWVSDETVSWKSFYAGKVKKRQVFTFERDPFVH